MNKAKAQNQEVGRQVRREMGRHSVDCSEVQVSASHGVIHLHGRVRALRGHEEILDAEIASFLKSLRSRQGVRDVITEWTRIV